MAQIIHQQSAHTRTASVQFVEGGGTHRKHAGRQRATTRMCTRSASIAARRTTSPTVASGTRRIKQVMGRKMDQIGDLAVRILGDKSQRESSKRNNHLVHEHVIFLSGSSREQNYSTANPHMLSAMLCGTTISGVICGPSFHRMP